MHLKRIVWTKRASKQASKQASKESQNINQDGGSAKGERLGVKNEDVSLDLFVLEKKANIQKFKSN